MNQTTHVTPRTTLREEAPTPYLDVRIGGLRLTLQRVPYRALSLALSAAAAAAAWFIR